ncbi:MAG: hypothetical protein DDT39_01670 [Firmicutes bacterium]|nr:hypothetical protein [candidate division NPL-UPA2 bacterium]
MQLIVANRPAVNSYRPLRRSVQPEQEPKNGALATATFTDEGNGGTFRHAKSYPIKR